MRYIVEEDPVAPVDEISEESAEAIARAAQAASVREVDPRADAAQQQAAGRAHATCLSIEHVNLFYGDHQALKDINLDIPEREITSFIGPSGCGKSTLLRCLNRMNDYVDGCRIEGKITLNGQDIYADFNTTLPMSIYDNVAYGPRGMGVKDRATLDGLVEESLRRAALWDEVKDKLKQSGLGLSGGQQQRLCIARAIAVRPQVLLMDEPTSALDPISTVQVEQLALELKRDYTLVVVTHNMQQASRISDSVAFFLLGELVEHGRTAQLFKAPRDQRTADYLTGRFG